jgi:hypothetical protein
MLFDLNGSKYMVKFKRQQTTTFAYLFKYINETIKFFPMNLAASLCNPKDRFVKSTGRKLALARLLKETQELNLSREDRVKIWEIYFKEHKK